MIFISQTNNPKSSESENKDGGFTSERIFCQHCLRTATNGIKCKGICVADSDY